MLLSPWIRLCVTHSEGSKTHEHVHTFVPGDEKAAGHLTVSSDCGHKHQLQE